MRNKAIALIISALLALQSAAAFAAGFDGEISYEVKDGKIKVINSVSNDSEEDVDILCITARYDDYGVLKKAYAEPLTVPAGLTEKVDVDYSYGCEAGDNIKMMIWNQNTIEPYVYQFKRLVSLFTCENFDNAKLVFPVYQSSSTGGYVIEGDIDGDNKTNFNDAVVIEPGRLDFGSSTYTLEGSNEFFEVASIKEGALYVNARSSDQTYTPAKFKLKFAENVTENITISARIKYEVYTPGTFRTNFMSVYDSRGRCAIQMIGTGGGLCAYNGSSLDSNVLVSKKNQWYTLKYDINLEEKYFTVYVDDKRMGQFSFNNQSVTDLSYIYFENGSTSNILGVCSDFYIDDITIDNGI